jgi:predicted HTH transcriptional regulator
MENKRTEYKRILNDDFEKKVVGFLNAKDGGHIYIGIDDDGSIFGVEQTDEVQKAIIGKFGTNILPSMLGLYDVDVEEREGKKVIHVTIASGAQKPYYIAQYGMSPKGCFIRSGSSCLPMTVEMIEDMRSRRTVNMLAEIASRRSELSFEQLKIYYQEKKKPLNNRFMTTLNLYTADDKPNYVAYLLADENGNPMQVAKFRSTDKSDLAENYEYGYCSLLRSLERILEKINVENTIKADIHFFGRKETPLLDKAALKESVINAVVHNDYSTEFSPQIIFYADRVEITSWGRLPIGVTQDDFFDGASRPRNIELMRVFKDLELVERLGTGIEKITSVYGREAFKFFTDHLIVVLPFNKEVMAERNSHADSIGINIGNGIGINVGINDTEKKMLELIRRNPSITAEAMATAIGIAPRNVEENIKKLREAGVLERRGSRRTGFWAILK